MKQGNQSFLPGNHCYEMFLILLSKVSLSNLYLRCFVRDQESLDFAQKWEKLRICFLFQRFFRSNESKYDVEENVNGSRF